MSTLKDHWLNGARELLPRAIELRRHIHRRPELGLYLPETTRAVREALHGLDVEIAEGAASSGLIVTVRGARPGRTVLLRGDMDALPMPEDTGLEFSSEIPGRMHACGHDAHTAMLAMAAHPLHANRGMHGVSGRGAGQRERHPRARMSFQSHGDRRADADARNRAACGHCRTLPAGP